ncbi:TonB-dependent receptor [Foetidibacter luteolus]|uniref:TonB-dependent receptor n=1 Tax=Foetidibacter luteolus TaxID=2608880 RepID=UPI00129B11AC|nr:TonB-dependent receptor [Foetidibacter luteolus]
MHKLYCVFLLIFLSLDTGVYAQADSTALKDSLITNDIQENVLDNLPVITLDELDAGESGGRLISSVLTAARDPFFTAASFNFSAARFKIRGYDADMFGVYINGLPMDNLDNGAAPWSLWGGLNDILRNREQNLGLGNNSFSFGDIGATTFIDARAAKQRKQTSLGYAWSNRSYTHRVMLTHSTGLTKRGWAFTLSASRRYADEGYVPGTWYNGYSYFAGLDKRIGQKHLLSLSVFGAPTEAAAQGGSVEEIQQLAGSHYYNAYWGYQNGKKRSAAINKTHQPYVILNHEFHIGSQTILTTSAGYSTGNKSRTGIDWYNAPDPRPDYYRYLPSFYKDDSIQYQQVYNLMHTDEAARQINWQRLYNVNRNSFETIQNADGVNGNTVTGNRSRYVVEERITNTSRINFNSNINAVIGDHIQISGGISYQQQRNHNYKVLNDLLGGDFYVNINQFAERDFPNDINAVQNDLDRPNRIIKTGDKFGYDYSIRITKAEEWGQVVFRFKHVDFFVAGNVAYTSFYRDGHVRNGLFPENSYGRSATYQFFNTGIKAGLTYKLDGRNYFFANVASLSRAPYFDNVYLSARTRDFTQPSVTSESIHTAEAGYTLNAPGLKLRLRGYYTQVNNGMNILSFYHDDYRSFVNYALSNIDKLHYGGEFGAEAKLAAGLSVNAAAAVGRYYYNSRQQATVTLDNSAELLETSTIYSQNFRVATTPQEAYSLGFSYRRPKFFINLTGNYFRESWLDYNPIRRTAAAVEGLDKQSDLYKTIITQTKWPPQYTLDFFGGYTWLLPKALRPTKYASIFFNAGISNLLDNKNMVTGGYEQLRFSSVEKDVGRFPPKTYYGYGRTYFLSATFRF